MRRASGRERRERRGVAAVELAAVMPLVVTLLLGLWDVSRITEVRQLLSNAAREGARQASTAQLEDGEVEGVVKDYLQSARINPAHVTVTVSNLTSPGTAAMDSTQLDELEVLVTIPFADVQLAGAHLVVGPSTQLRARAVCYSVRNKPYGAPPEPGIE